MNDRLSSLKRNQNQYTEVDYVPEVVQGSVSLTSLVSFYSEVDAIKAEINGLRETTTNIFELSNQVFLIESKYTFCVDKLILKTSMRVV
jgi:hypothetical protein